VLRSPNDRSGTTFVVFRRIRTRKPLHVGLLFYGFRTETRRMSNEVGKRIKAARERRKWNQEELAAAVGVSARTVGNWERGATVPKNRLGALADILGPIIDPANDPMVSSRRGPSPEIELLFAHYGELTQMDLFRLSKLISDDAIGGEDSGR